MEDSPILNHQEKVEYYERLRDQALNELAYYNRKLGELMLRNWEEECTPN